MKKYSYLIIIVLILSLVLTGCSLLSNIGQAPATGQSGITYLTKGLPTGLVGLWHFSEVGALDITNDSSGNDNHGKVHGASLDDGQPGFGEALSFDGVDDYVEVDDSTSLDITGDLTIEAWVKFDDFTVPHSYIVGKDTVGQRSYGLAVDGGHYGPDYIGRVGFVVFKDGGVPSIHWGNTVLSTGQWYHIAATYDFVTDGNSVMTIYVDGNRDSPAKTNAMGPIYSGSANLQIGARQYGTSRCFVDGTIDEVRIWNVALSEGQLRKFYDFDGFFPPVDNNGLNVAKAGRAIPVKFSLSGDQGLNIFEPGYPKSVEFFCTGGSDPDAIIEGTDTAGGSILSYDAIEGEYVYVWKTEKKWVDHCRQLVVRLNDGKSYYANFKFK